ncbi:IPT/TIG domain-containing protein [Acidipila sp. EB88]|uniref:IPT/TIG domain-containing protein n=1 Tax=Acidipila sp. EB88 TaxID=2305226 RepID=UPI0013157912|nr:IPT/TIG domain-containing protein [Acidipila sp. EB88]
MRSNKSRSCKHLQVRVAIGILLLAGIAGLVRSAEASGPHWVAGVNYFNPAAKGAPVVWAGGKVSYYLDQGALSGSVSNSQAASMVAAAASVWSSVPTAAVAITQGGSLGEDVSGSNVTANGNNNGATLPTDAQSSTTSKPVAVVFDADGSVINAIEGAGSSDASSCTTDGVYTTVDNFSATGNIVHALIVVNGLCATSSALDGLLQYQLVRAFGRVLGLDWSQVNEAMWLNNSPTTDGLTGWPVMHPMERLCSDSSTNCLPNPTTLRTDDIAGLNQLYPVTTANSSSWSSKTLTAPATITVQGVISFRNGQGMQGVNVVLTPLDATANGNTPDLRYTVSAVSGAYFRADAANVVAGPVDAQGNLYGRFGTDDATKEGYFILSGVPLPAGSTSATYQLSIEPINPLYTGVQGVGPYAANQVTPSGTLQTVTLGPLSAGANISQNFTMSDSADGTQTDDGLEASPNGTGGNGEWLAKLVGYGHAGWFQFHARANRIFTVEASSLDASGLGTEGKAAVLIGVWDGVDALGSLPALASTVPFNGAQVGLSTLSAQTEVDEEVRIAYADLRGDGRPDYSYRARLLYADSVFPARLPLAGGSIVIHGQGFRPGASVLVNGAAAAVTSVTPTEITAAAPAVSAPTGTVLVTVQDPQTLGTAQILDGLSYDAQGTDAVRLVAGPSGSLSEGVPVAMTVQVVAADGKTPAANVTVTYAVTAGSAGLSCAVNPCTATTNGNGMATVMVSAATSSATQVTASLANGASVIAEFDGGTPPSIAATNTLYLAIGSQISWTPVAIILNNGKTVQGTAVQWSGSAGAQVVTAASTSNAAGLASTTVTAGPLAAGSTANVYACEAGSSPCATFTINADHAELAALVPVSGVGQSLAAAGIAMPVTVEVIDGVGHPLAGAMVNFYQQMTAWEPPCPMQGRCPAAPLLGTASSTAVSDANGLVTLAPMANNGQAVTISMLATTGQQGTLQWSITQHP